MTPATVPTADLLAPVALALCQTLQLGRRAVHTLKGRPIAFAGQREPEQGVV